MANCWACQNVQHEKVFSKANHEVSMRGQKMVGYIITKAGYE